MILVNQSDRDQWRSVGQAWSGLGEKQLPPPPARLLEAWKLLSVSFDEPIFKAAGYQKRAREWWKVALELFAISDEAALNIGFETEAHGKSAQSLFVERPLREALKVGSHADAQRQSFTLSSADPDHVCVLPKSRTARMGCTLRSLSHNLSLLPERGVARAYWSLAPETQSAPHDSDPKPFNVVILPVPFAIRASAFKGVPSDEGSWGWFDVEAHWCPPSGGTLEEEALAKFLNFVDSVLDNAANDSGPIHGLILPEVALSEDVFRELCEHLKTREEFELVVSGLFDARVPSPKHLRSGNFTGMARFLRTSEKAGFDISIREKHHRWKLDRSQIETYSLGASLDINRGWWEHIDILSRSIDVFVLRGNATITTLICEDLARNDPCQELIRSIGPNFVIALLMDGPQLKHRWPARYATVLADDPGSSVLTVTSLGLIRRSNATGKYPQSNQIGLFQDDAGDVTELKLPHNAQALCITLQPTKITERTLDGRADKGDAQSWRLVGVQPISVEKPELSILEGKWPNQGTLFLVG
ncbi:hypothetical protein [Agrobacterium rosae]|uniref:hypothetical protein n=1 Tax=Agrobacterium rosae TaxID=1972867 RepID=UPI002034602B|nr:hypothetical protein [Agrobacterium rosae]MCM2435847.1 hypothetical protein [Agrobacterium rosae]